MCHSYHVTTQYHASEFSATERVSCQQVSEETMRRCHGDMITRELVARAQKKGGYQGWYRQLNASSSAFTCESKRVYSREQTRLHERANTFITGDKHIHLRRQTCLSPETNAFASGDKCVCLWRQTRLSPETNACRTHLRYTLSLTSTVCSSHLDFD